MRDWATRGWSGRNNSPEVKVVLSIFKRELRSYLLSPLAYVLLAVFVGLGSYFFSVILLSTRIADLGGYFANMALVAMFIAPLLTMRLWSEEEQKGTAELLLTSPVTMAGIVLGKYLAALVVYLVAVGISLLYPLILGLYGEPDWGPVISSYLGFILLGATYLAVGFFASSLTSSQLLAGVTGIGILLLFWIVGWLSSALGPGVGQVAGYLSVLNQFDDFLKGILDSTHLVYYGSLIAAFLFLSVQNLQRRVWGD